jgi:AcrR family transcriptional regulator
MTEAGRTRRRPRTPSVRVEQDLISAAEKVLARDGVGGLTIRAVAEEAKIAPMGIYNRLGGKAGLINMLLTGAFDRLRTALEAAAEPDPLTRLREYALYYRRFALENPIFYRFIFEDVSAGNREVTQVRELAASCYLVLLRGMELAAAAGHIDAAERLEATQQLWSAMHGAVVLELRGLVQTPDPEVTYRKLVDSVLGGFPNRASPWPNDHSG